jgi:hypothetical protein
MPDLRIGFCTSMPLEFTFERVEDSLRLFLVNADESGSMGGHMHQNVSAFDAVAGVLGGRADVVILHGFESDSRYDVFYSRVARERLGDPAALLTAGRGEASTVSDAREAVSAARANLTQHQARGSTNPRSHAAFLERLGKALGTASGDVELIVLNSSDGGFDGGASSPMTKAIDTAMRSLTARCRCSLAANVLVGSAGSPDALTFFTGDPERFDNRLLFSTERASEGVLRLRDFSPSSVNLADSNTPTHTVSPGVPCWSVQPVEDAAPTPTGLWSAIKSRALGRPSEPVRASRILTWHPEGSHDRPAELVVRRIEPQPGGRRAVLRAVVRPEYGDVTLDRDGAAVFALIARSLSENPYLRETSRAELNQLIAPLERLLGTRTAVVAMLTASPEARARVDALRTQVEENTAAIRGVIGQEGLTPHERSSRVNTLNNVRHLLKGDLRKTSEALEQQALERELGFYEQHPNHWLVWLQPALDELKAQLERTQADPGDAMKHLSTRIRTARSANDGQARAEDRYLDKLLAESRARRDRADRKADPRDVIPFESPAAWTDEVCPVSGRPLSAGIAAIPFVADRSDLTSGNIMAGGQNVDRMPIDPGPLLSLEAVRELMWGELGQMASPYSSGGRWYNAAIPVHLGPASKSSMRDLERAIGWLCTGTTAFGPQMAEAIPAALAVILGAPSEAPGAGDQAQALLRTSALLSHYPTYPYVAGTSVFDETAAKVPLTAAWAASVEGATGAASLQNMGCISSLFARAVAADRVAPEHVAEDLFAWACRNIARGILSATAPDGRGGVEGVRRFAALLDHLVELEGHPLELEHTSVAERAAVPEVDGVLDAEALAWVLGPAAPYLHLSAPVSLSSFTDRFNVALAAVPPAQVMALLDELGGVFSRLDRVIGAATSGATELRVDALAAVPALPAPLFTGQTHAGFDDLVALEALRPLRFSTPAPVLASPLAGLRRITKASETRWIPPADAALPRASINPSAASYLEAHTALYPVRAWLRLADAGLVGQEALRKLRASPVDAPIPPLPRMLPRLAQLMGGMEAVVLTLRRAFAFVVANAFSYADNQWVTSPLRTADAEALDAVLGARPTPAERVRAYTARDVPVIDDAEEWPKMDAHGYLPKSRAIDAAGRVFQEPVRLPAEALVGNDRQVCEKACAVLIEGLVSTGVFVIGGLHRCSRRVLGEYPADLSLASREEQARVIREELVPVVAGRVRGDVQDPRFFAHCAFVLEQLLALGGDTRRFEGEEPEALLSAEAREIRSREL